MYSTSSGGASVCSKSPQLDVVEFIGGTKIA
jgi:hypothetical protein